MSKKSTVAALAVALAGLAAAPLAHSADAPTNPPGAEQKILVALKRRVQILVDPQRKKQPILVDLLIPADLKNVKPQSNYLHAYPIQSLVSSSRVS